MECFRENSLDADGNDAFTKHPLLVDKIGKKNTFYIRYLYSHMCVIYDICKHFNLEDVVFI